MTDLLEDTPVIVQTSLTSKRPGGKGKGFGSRGRPYEKKTDPPTEVKKSYFRKDEPSPSRTEELNGSDWMDSDREDDKELERIIAETTTKQLQNLENI